MGFFNKLLREANHINAVTKDVKMVGDLLTGDTKKVKRRVINKTKGKIARKVFNSIKF